MYVLHVTRKDYTCVMTVKCFLVYFLVPTCLSKCSGAVLLLSPAVETSRPPAAGAAAGAWLTLQDNPLPWVVGDPRLLNPGIHVGTQLDRLVEGRHAAT